MSDASILMIGVSIASAIVTSILNIVYQVYRMANRDGAGQLLGSNLSLEEAEAGPIDLSEKTTQMPESHF